MDRTPWILASILAVPLLGAAGCKDSNPNYISFDASPDSAASDAKRDGVASDAAPGDGSRSDAPTDTLASETLPGSDAATDATGAEDTSLDTAPDGTLDAEPGQ